ncbi:MAG TPA: aminodeoxychorismate synthase component I [Steroidobacteraceae bacterium]
MNTPAFLTCPVTACPEDLRRLAYADPQAFPVLFDSAAIGPLGRYSILAAYPDAALWQDGQGQLTGFGLGSAAQGRGFLDALDELWRASATAPEEAAPAPSAAPHAAPGPFHGGWVAYLGYELAAEVEPQLALPTLIAGTAPRAFALRVPAALIYDHDTCTAWSLVETGREALHQRLAHDLAVVAPGPAAADLAPLLGALELEEEDPQRFGACVGAALEHIRAGDIYQANLSRGWRAALNRGTLQGCAGLGLDRAGAALYERLRALNPAPFAALAQFQGWRALCSSPERLVRVSGRRVETRPIAGTRPRSRIAGADRRELDALITHPKERAEHIMLVDLERNDLGRICRPGSVRADELMITESYAHVHHIVSNVCGELNPGQTPVDVLRAVFPGGSITGCPKFRCMQIIAALEGEARGAYTGALGFINRDGSMDFNILIRTITMDSDGLEFRAGAGIVADSDWRLELQETRAKARGLIAALQHP